MRMTSALRAPPDRRRSARSVLPRCVCPSGVATSAGLSLTLSGPLGHDTVDKCLIGTRRRTAPCPSAARRSRNAGSSPHGSDLRDGSANEISPGLIGVHVLFEDGSDVVYQDTSASRRNGGDEN